MWSVVWTTNSPFTKSPYIDMDPLLSYIGKMRILQINFSFICLIVTLQIILVILLVKYSLCLCDKTEEAVIFTSSGCVHYRHYQL